MGQAPTCCSCSDRAERLRGGLDDQRVVLLHTVELGAFAEGPLAEANEALLESVALGRRGKVAEASAKLAAAERVLAAAPHSPAAAQLRRACRTDPELQEIRKRSPAAAGVAAAKGGALADERARRKHRKGHKRKDARTAVDVDGLLAGLEADIAQVRKLCSSVHIFEAHAALEQLEGKAKAALRECAGRADDAINGFAKRLKIDPTFHKLRAVHGRMQRALVMMKAADPKGCPPIVIKDPDLHQDFRLELILRPAEGAELEKGGPSTQLMAILKLYNWPLSLKHTIAVDCEVDVFRREWVKDCKGREGTVGGPQQLFSNLAVTNIALSPLPLQLEEVQVREFAVCPSPPLQGCRPGVLVLESSPPGNSVLWENWTIPKPPTKRGCYRMASGVKVHFKMPSAKGPEYTDFVSVSRVSLPIPQWMLPLETLKGIIASKLQASLKQMKDGLIDHWAELQYEDRMAANRPFYSAVDAVQRPAEAPSEPGK